MPGILLGSKLTCINESSDGVLFAICVSRIKSVECTAAVWSSGSVMTRFIFINFFTAMFVKSKQVPGHVEVYLVWTHVGIKFSGKHAKLWRLYNER